MPLLDFHEVANIFPMMSDEEYSALKEDMRDNGLHEPIWLYDNQIIDGRNRYNACVELDIEPTFRTWDGRGDLVEFVVSLNLHRRHLTASQRAIVALDVIAYHEAQARKRQIEQLKQNQGDTVPELIPERTKGDSRDKAGETVGVNGRYVSDAKRIAERRPDLVIPVRNGDISIPQAMNIMKAYNDSSSLLPLTASNHAVSFDPNYDGDEWYTPGDTIQMARSVMGGIDLDPASCEEAQTVIHAREFFTKQDDGLAREWFGRVWLNPPYSMPTVEQFTEKAIAEYERGTVEQCLLLVNNCTDTNWFHSLLSREFPFCLQRRRTKFWRNAHDDTFAARQGQVIFYMGDSKDKFCSVFSDAGVVCQGVRL